MSGTTIALTAGVSFIVALLAPFLLIPVLRRFGVIDTPNERSSHTAPALRGAGLATLAGVMAGIILLLLLVDQADRGILAILGMVLVAVAVLGAIEDWRGLPILVRAALQFTVGCILGAGLVYFTGQTWLLVPLIGFFFAAYVNVANFMDGVNGISGLHGLVAGGVYSFLSWHSGLNWLSAASLIIALAFAAFLPWNLGRGRIFLGDAGSYLLGGAMAALAATLVVLGTPVPAVIGPIALYLVDTGLTLLVRILRGERWYASHRSHVYQRLTDVGLSHVQVAMLVAAVTAGISALSWGGVVANDWISAAMMYTTALLLLAAYCALPAILHRQRAARASVE